MVRQDGQWERVLVDNLKRFDRAVPPCSQKARDRAKTRIQTWYKCGDCDVRMCPDCFFVYNILLDELIVDDFFCER